MAFRIRFASLDASPRASCKSFLKSAQHFILSCGRVPGRAQIALSLILTSIFELDCAFVGPAPGKMPIRRIAGSEMRARSDECAERAIVRSRRLPASRFPRCRYC